MAAAILPRRRFTPYLESLLKRIPARTGLAPAVHLAAPSARLGAALLDQVLELLDRVLDLVRDDPHRVADLFDHALRLVVHRQLDARALLVERLEAHRAGIGGARDAAPGDALIGDLLDDLGVPLFFLAGDARAPVQVRVVDLADLFHALHEAGELLELRPLVVHGVDRAIHFKNFLDSFHGYPSVRSTAEAARIVPRAHRERALLNASSAEHDFL